MRCSQVACFAVLLGAAASLFTGCSSDAWFGSGPGAEAAVTTPSGVQSGLVDVVYTLSGEDISETDISVSYSEGGSAFRRATEGPGGDGTENLSVSSTGEAHIFVWDSGADLEGARASSVVIRIQPEEGTGDVSEALSIHNARFLVALESQAAGSLRFYALDVVDGSARYVRTYSTGGNDPYDVLFDDSFFFVTHRTTNDVAVFQLDEDIETLTAAEGSPFGTDGSGSKYLASDGTHIFVSNTTSGTLTVFNLDGGSGKLTLNATSGVSAAGCRSLVVRSGRLFVASETAGHIRIFDVEADGELVENGASPVTSGGLASPRAMVLAGSRLYAANATSATLCGFNVQGDGDLATLAGSPFTVSGSGIEQLARNGAKLFAVTGAGASLLTLTTDSFGAVAEDAGSPLALTGPSSSVLSAGSVAAAATTTSKKLETWVIDEAGAVSEADSSPISAAVEVIRIAVSD